MSEYLVPLKNPQPNAEEFIQSIKGETIPRHVPLFEYLVDDVLMQPILTEMMGRPWIPPPEGGTASTGDAVASRNPAYWDNFIQFWYRMGYPFVRLELSLAFQAHHRLTADTAARANKDRAWADQHHGMIASWEDFEKFPWPQVKDFDFWPFEYVATHLPEGLGLIANHAGGPFEWLSHMLSYEGLSLLLYDDPQLVKAVADRIGGLMEEFYRHIRDLPNLIAIFPGDDMGFRTGTLVAPEHLRYLTLPWHKRFAQMTHEKGLLYFLHACGNVEAVMEDLIEDVGIDAKHSFEDAIIPTAEFYARYADRIGVLGGVDIDVLTRASEEELRAYVRNLLDQCAPGGRFALGSGNSIPSYIPLNNYLAMQDEALMYSL